VVERPELSVVATGSTASVTNADVTLRIPPSVLRERFKE
jgi:hypothetical protein